MGKRIGCCAVIPARGGSKGVPGKNLARVGGETLLARAIRAAHGAAPVERVIVSTDAPAIAREAQRCGAEVIERPASLAGDAASSESALLHVLQTLDAREGYRPETLVFLQCTSPLIRSADIEGTLLALSEQAADSALAVAASHAFLWKRGEGGQAAAVGHDSRVRPRRQEREAQFVETGSVYAMRAEGFEKSGHRFFGRIALHEVDAERAIEIDGELDLELAEHLHRRAQRGVAVEQLPTPLEALAMDFDGVLTDDRVWLSQSGEESVVCHRGDGLGLERLRGRGVELVVISRERNPVVAARCQKLGVECHHGVDDKVAVLRRWADERGIRLSQTVFVGNDVNDLDALASVGCGVAVGDAHPELRRAAAFCLDRAGGRGAVRELADRILEHLEAGER